MLSDKVKMTIKKYKDTVIYLAFSVLFLSTAIGSFAAGNTFFALFSAAFFIWTIRNIFGEFFKLTDKQKDDIADSMDEFLYGGIPSQYERLSTLIQEVKDNTNAAKSCWCDSITATEDTLKNATPNPCSGCKSCERKHD